MTGYVRQENGIPGRYNIELLLVRKFLIRPESVVPPAARDPLPCFVLSNRIGQALLYFRHRIRAVQLHCEQVRAGAAEMHVGIVEPGQDEAALPLHYLCAPLAAATVNKARFDSADAWHFSG